MHGSPALLHFLRMPTNAHCHHPDSGADGKEGRRWLKGPSVHSATLMSEDTMQIQVILPLYLNKFIIRMNEGRITCLNSKGCSTM